MKPKLNRLDFRSIARTIDPHREKYAEDILYLKYLGLMKETPVSYSIGDTIDVNYVQEGQPVGSTGKRVVVWTKRGQRLCRQLSGDSIGRLMALAELRHIVNGGHKMHNYEQYLKKQVKKIEDHKWIESEKAGRDLGQCAITDWVDKFAGHFRKEYAIEDMIDAIKELADVEHLIKDPQVKQIIQKCKEKVEDAEELLEDEMKKNGKEKK